MAAGPASANEKDVDAILARLRDELENRGSGEDGGAPRLAARSEAERLWAVSADRPYLYKPGLAGRVRGLVLVPVKALTRRLMRWYVEPLAADQRAFNGAILRAIDELSERLGRDLSRSEQGVHGALEEQGASQSAFRDRASRLLDELEERLFRLERRPPGTKPTQAAPAASSAVPEPAFDYFSLEMRIRGPRAGVRESQEPYVEVFKEAAPVLDVGAGRGEFLDLLREAGIEASGVELDQELVDYGRSQGLAMEHGDAVGYLETLEDGSLGGIFAAQLVEHLPPPALVGFLGLAAAKLRPGGLLVAETINPLALVALKHYFADPTHAQPLVPQTLEVLARQAGFSRTELHFLHVPPPEERLQPVDLPQGAEFDGARAALARNVELLNTVVFGAQDYALHAWK
ncbi:MAG: methyltransferase domain-containing protein [Actinomycetota bacterium]